MPDLPTRGQQQRLQAPPISSRPMWPTPRRPKRAALPQVLELLGILAFLFLGYEITVWAWTRTAPKEVGVPRILGLQQREAVMLLESAGLGYEVTAEKSSETVPEGAIIAAEPGPDRTIKMGRIIRLTISSGSRWARMPDVKDMSVDRARALLKQAKLVVRRERARYDRKVPVGYVLGQNLASGTKVPVGTQVDLVVSKGPQPETEFAEERPARVGPRGTEIKLIVPPGASLQEVRIVVTDREGEQLVYHEHHEPGEEISQTVSGEGPKAVVRVYLSGLLVQERNF